MPHNAMTVQVTAEDIQKGVRGQSCKCPVALAMKRTLRLRKSIVACYGCSYTLWDSKFKRVMKIGKFPRSVRLFIRAYDKGEPVAPFTFETP